MPPATVVAVSPARRVHGRVTVPGDKSISHRYAIIASLSEGRSELHHFSSGADCHSTLACLRALGVEIGISGTTITILGRGLRGYRSPVAPLDAGNSGTTMRMLCGILAAQPFTTQIIGDASLSKRPMRRVIEPLSTMGARIDSVEGRPPLTVHGTSLSPVTFVAPLPSAQVKSAVVLAGLHAGGITSVVEPVQTRDHTERALAAFGFDVQVDGLRVSVAGGQRGHGQQLPVPGDFSSAAFWLVAAAGCPGSSVTVEGVGLNPTRTGLLEILRRFGARVEVAYTGKAAGEPLGSVTVHGADLGSVTIEGDEVPGVIDELPAIAALAARGGEVHVRGAGELRVKESDRISVLVHGFQALGLDAEEAPDGFRVRGAGTHRGGTAHAHLDHRMAMAFALAGISGTGPSHIDGADAVAISYPDFFTTLQRLVA